MPYNNAPISPPEEITGSSSLPLARIKKIIAMDEDIAQCSNSAAFAISVATEIFIRYLTEMSYNVVKAERKPRRNIAYKDIATAVSRIDNLEFLADVIPRTKTFREFKEQKAREEAEAANAVPGQTTLQNGTNGQIEVHPADPAAHREGVNGEMDFRPSSSRGMSLSNGSPIVDRTLTSTLHGHPISDDIEMQD